jgi:NTE family protein
MDADRFALFSAVPLFSAFNREELEAAAERFVELSYRRGDVVCTEGEEGETFFVCLSGELEVSVGSPPRIVNRLGPGECVGEMSLLVGGPRIATVVASRPSHLLALDKVVFERFFLHNAKILEYFSRVLCKRLATGNQGRVAARSSSTVAVTAAPGLKGKTLVAGAVARLVRAFAGDEVVLLSVGAGGAARSLSELVGAGAERHLREDGLGVPVLTLSPASTRDGDDLADQLAALAERLGDRFHWIFLDLGDDTAGLGRAAAEVADMVVRIVHRYEACPGRPPRSRTLHVVNLYNTSSPIVPVNHTEPYILGADSALEALGRSDQAAHVLLHPRSPAAPALHRLARKLLGTTVGMAFGGGAAFGLTHLGVLKVLEANGIAVDLVAGSSMGGLVALGFGAGFEAAEMIDNALRLGTIRNTLWATLDLSLTKPALMSGDRLAKLLMPLIGSITSFDQLARPCRVVATDIESGERVSIGSGALEVAGRASCAIPMLWCPVKHDGRILVDGGVTDPVPAEVVLEMGADICIAVNAVPRLRRGVETVLSRLYRRIKRFDPFSYVTGSRDLPNMFDLIMNTMQTLQHELGNFRAITADVRINPDVSALTWVEFYKPQAFIDRGAEAAERALPEIKRVLAERRGTRPAPSDAGLRAAARS